MRRFAVIFALFLLVIVGILGLQLFASESGEVVVVTTHGSDGEPFSTRLWVIDKNGAPWLRAGSMKSTWYQRLLENPQIEVRRGEHAFTALSVPRPEFQQRINDSMVEKYGWADKFIGLLFGRGNSIPIELIVDSNDR
jgi:hypothetical protein